MKPKGKTFIGFHTTTFDCNNENIYRVEMPKASALFCISQNNNERRNPFGKERKKQKMDRKQYFEKHYSKLRFEAWLGAALIGVIAGLFAGAAVALVTWFFAYNGLLASILSTVGVTAIVTPLVYLAKFRPDVVKNARRLDRLGLEERLVTMVEYANDDSFIAEVQREDAKLSLAKLASSAIKFTLSKASLVLIIVSASLFTTANTLEVLASTGLIPGGDSFIEEEIEEEVIEYVTVTYEAEGGGFFTGEDIQLIPKGTASTQVVAVADEGWMFVEWDDGYKKPARSDKNINEDVTFIAIFTMTGEEGDPSQEDPNADPSDKPKDSPQQQEQQNQDQQEQDKQEQENQDQQQQDKPKPEPGDPTHGGSKYQEANQVIDGETYYKDALNGTDGSEEESYREKLIKRLEEEGANLTEEERYIIESYLAIV